jgi:hypothetical protein
VNIKAQGLLNAVKWVEEEYGISTLQEIIRACSPAVRERYVSAIAINWHPMEELVEFLDVAERVLGHSDGKIAEQIGAAGARANMKGVVVRFAFYVARPEYLLTRLSGLWSQFNDEGSMKFVELSPHSLTVEVQGVSTPNWLFCQTITGWSREVAAATAMIHPTAKHTHCRARGAARCLWDVRGLPSGGQPQGEPGSGPASQGNIRILKP